MYELNLILKNFYQQHAGFIDVELLKRQQIGINNKLSNLNQILTDNKIILDSKVFDYFKKRLEKLEKMFKAEKKNKDKIKAIKAEKKLIFSPDSLYSKSFKKISPEEKEEIKSEIMELKNQKSQNKLKLLSKKINIKNFDKFYSFYINIDQNIINNYSEYIIKNIKYNQIKNKNELKDAVIYLKKLLTLKSFYPLFSGKGIKNLLEGDIPDQPISVLKNLILEVEKSIYQHFEENTKQKVDEDQNKIELLENEKRKLELFIYQLEEISSIKYDTIIKLDDIYDDFNDIFNLEQLSYSKENFIEDIIRKNLELVLQNDYNINKLFSYQERTIKKLIDNKLNNKEGIFMYFNNLNKLKLNLFFNIKDREYNYDNIKNKNDLYNFITKKYNLDLFDEITFFEPFFEPFIIYDTINLFLFIKDKNLDNHNLIINTQYPLNDQELEQLIEDIDLSKYEMNLLKYSNSDLIYTQNIPRDIVSILSKIRYYNEQKKLSYNKRLNNFFDKLQRLQTQLLNLLLGLENHNFSIHTDFIDSFESHRYELNNFFRNTDSPNTINKIIKNLVNKSKNKIKEKSNKLSDFQNIKSNLVDRKSALIYESNTLQIYQPRNMKESIKYGQNTAWCTAASSNNMFCGYHNPNFNNLFIFIPKNSKYIDCVKTNHDGEEILDENGNPKIVKSLLKYQLDAEGMDLMDPCDKPVKICDLIKEYPDIKYFLRFIPYYKYKC